MDEAPAHFPATRSPLDRLLRMYEARRVLLSPMGHRGPVALLLAATLSFALLSILVSLSWVQKSDVDYLRGSAGVTMLDELPWTLVLPGEPPVTKTVAELGETSIKHVGGEPFSARATLDASVVAAFMAAAGEASVVLSLPPIGFERMRVETSWLPTRTLVRGEPATLVFTRAMTEGVARFDVTLTVWPHNTQERVVRSSVNATPTFLAVQSRYQKFQDFVAGRRTGSGKQLADIGRIVLALFAILLFIFIDSSAECLALGVFMSLKALAVAVGQGWLPDGMFSAQAMDNARHFLLSFADVMQLYFFTQLARLWRPRPLHWLVGGIAFGILYTLVCRIVPEPGGINWPFQAWKWRNVSIGLACLACALPVAYVCWRARLYHRTTALLVASSGVVVQVVTPMIVDVPGVTESVWYKTWYNLFETHTPYMFALSTFINVSTLEKRVKTLTRAALRKEAIERELTLGKAVQDAFFQIPELPPSIAMSYAHEAAEYVSGDILYSYWDRQANTVTMVLCDVTGHGVQAALKATICSAMCASIWEHGHLRPGDDPAHRLAILHRRVTAYLTKTAGNPEILSMTGCELDLATGAIRLYRANGIHPVVVSRTDAGWRVGVQAVPSGRLESLRPADAAFVVLFSDGIIDGPRTLKRLLQHVETTLGDATEVSAAKVKDAVMGFQGFVETRDDKTMAVLEVRAAA